MPSLTQIDLGQVAATVTVGTTTTGTPGTSASVSNSGTTANAVFDFTVPAGESGCYLTIAQTESSVTITPQTVNVWGVMASLDITLSAPADTTKLNEYVFCFNSGSTATTLSVPASVTWTATVTIEANKHYEASIVYNPTNQAYYGIIVGWAWTAPSA